MIIELKKIQKELAHHKVYNAWQYIESLNETLTYMSASYSLIKQVYEYRVDTLKERGQSIIRKAISTGNANVSSNDLKCTNITIAGLEIDDELYLKKTTLEFFHYARVSIDILFQIINAALLGDQGLNDMDKRIIPNTNTQLDNNPVFADLKKKLDDNKKNDTYKYLQAFDNYNKHIKTILISVNNSFILGEKNEFIIKNFNYSDRNETYSYPSYDALFKINEIQDYVYITVKEILKEIEKQLPNCLDNRARIQDIKYNIQLKQTEKGPIADFISFFIEVNNDLSELPSEIKILPLIVKPNDEIYSFDFQFDTIFIKLKSQDESSIIGYAKKKNIVDTNELYKAFDVFPCGQEKYYEYLAFFKDNYTNNVTINPYAMEGTMLIYKD